MNKSISFFVFLFAIPVICRCQTDTVYYDDNKQITTWDYASNYRIYHLESNGLYKTEDRLIKRNKLEMTGYFTAKKNGLRNGLFVYYDENEDKTHEGAYNLDINEGDWKYYYTGTSNIWHIDKYQNGKVIELTSYYQSGKLKRREKYDNDGHAIGKCLDEEGKEITFTAFHPKGKPTFNLHEYIAQNLHYPAEASGDNVQGKVMVKFAVTETGTISDIEVIQHLSEACDKEAVRIVSMMPKWNLYIVDDKPVKIFFSLPIVFKLQ